MTRAVLVLVSDATRNRAIDWVRRAEHGSRVEFSGPKRTINQNDKFHPMLTDIALQLTWYGKKRHKDLWQDIIISSLNEKAPETVPNWHGNGVVSAVKSSTRLSVEEMSGLIEIMYAFGAEHGIEWSEPKEPTGE